MIGDEPYTLGLFDTAGKEMKRTKATSNERKQKKNKGALPQHPETWRRGKGDDICQPTHSPPWHVMHARGGDKNKEYHDPSAPFFFVSSFVDWPLFANFSSLVYLHMTIYPCRSGGLRSSSPIVVPPNGCILGLLLRHLACFVWERQRKVAPRGSPPLPRCPLLDCRNPGRFARWCCSRREVVASEAETNFGRERWASLPRAERHQVRRVLCPDPEGFEERLWRGDRCRIGAPGCQEEDQVLGPLKE